MPSKSRNPHPGNSVFRKAAATAVIPLMTANTPNTNTRADSVIFGHLNFLHVVPTDDAAAAHRVQRPLIERIMGTHRSFDHLRTCYLLGTPRQIRERIAELAAAGLEYLVLTPLDYDLEQLDLWEARAKEQGGQSRLLSAAASLRRKAGAIEEELVQVKAKSRQDTLNYPAKLNAKLAGLLGSVGGADYAPTKGMRDVFEDLSRRVAAQVAKWTALADSDVVAFDRLVRSSGVPAVGMARSSKGMPRRIARRPAARRPVRR